MAERARIGLAGLKVAIDVQHLWKPPPSDRDHGAVFTLPDGRHTTEADAALLYAAALAAWLEGRGALVLRNDPTRRVMVGRYADRHRTALSWGAQVYLACHLNAGGGRYGLVEWLNGNPGEPLANAIVGELRNIAEVGAAHGKALNAGERGTLCVQGCGARIAALILEPFFGDSPSMQPLLAPARLLEVGAAIGSGVARWWERVQERAAVL